MPGIDTFSLSNQGLDGSSGVLFAQGQGVGSTTLEQFVRSNGVSDAAYGLTVTGLWFMPDLILIKNLNDTSYFQNQTIVDINDPKHSSGFNVFAVGGSLFRLTAPAYINENGFKLPIMGSASTPKEWMAFKYKR